MRDLIIQRLAAFPKGLSVEALAQGLGPDAPPRRTLQRRLAAGVAAGAWIRVGRGRATLYALAQPAHGGPLLAATPVVAGSGERSASAIPLSPEAAALARRIDMPRHQRSPVGYRSEFLDDYRPNRTAWIEPKLRAQLHDMGRATGDPGPAGTFARRVFDRLLIDLSWASSRLEGNTYSRLDTQRLIEQGQAAEGKDAIETQMILNHKAAIEYLVLQPGHSRVDAPTLVALHALLADGLMADPAMVGRLRRRPVEITGSVYLPIALPQRLEAVFETLVDKAAAIDDPFEQAFFLMVQIPYLQPFEDVNKRLSRVAANIPLMQRDLCPLSFVDVPDTLYVQAMLAVYELNRVELLRDLFVWAYERSCQQYAAVRQSLVPPDPFRLRHRQALSKTIAAVVRDGVDPTVANLRARIPPEVPGPDRQEFLKRVRVEFTTLHAGNAVRFGVRPLEWQAWEQRSGRRRRST